MPLWGKVVEQSKGISFLAVGVVACLFSVVRFFRARAQIEIGRFEP
jgi:hypothetical protein